MAKKHPTTERILELALNGKSPKQILSQLIKDGTTSPTGLAWDITLVWNRLCELRAKGLLPGTEKPSYRKYVEAKIRSSKPESQT
jgi:hypothetical protein